MNEVTATHLINTLEAPGEFDAASKLRPGEPYFLLLGRDRSAPKRVYDWAQENRRKALAEFDDGKITKDERDRELRKCTEAEDIAEAMVEYKRGWEQREAARPAARPTYSGHQLPAETLRRDQLQAAKARLRAALGNAVAEAAEVSQMLLAEEQLDGEPGDNAADLRNLLADLMGDMQSMATAVTPARPVLQQ